MENVILTPHIGGSTEEAQCAIANDVTSKILDFLQNGSTIGAVNLPQLSLTRIQPDGDLAATSIRQIYRIANVHHNIPGALRDINKCLECFNILQQNLSTLDKIGYCIIDCTPISSTESIDDAMEKIRKLPQTIQCFKI